MKEHKVVENQFSWLQKFAKNLGEMFDRTAEVTRTMHLRTENLNTESGPIPCTMHSVVAMDDGAGMSGEKKFLLVKFAIHKTPIFISLFCDISKHSLA